MSTNEDNLSVLRDTIEKATQEGRFDEVALGLIDLAEIAPDVEERASAIARAATVFDEQLSDTGQAVVLWGVLVELYEESERYADAATIVEVLATKGDDTVSSLETLTELYAETEDWPSLVRTYQRLFDTYDDITQKVEACRQMALIEKEALGRAEEALAAQELILSLIPNDHEAFTAIESAHHDAERWEALKNLYVKRAEDAQDESRPEWLKKAADIAERLGDDSTEKNRLLEQILKEKPDDTQAFKALETQARDSEDWETLSDLLVKRAEAKPDIDAKLALLVEAADVQMSKRQDPVSAIPYYERALRVKKTHGPAIDGLLEALNATEQYELSSKLYELKLHLSDGETQEIDVRLALAHLQHAKLNNRSEAMKLYEQTLQLDPECREALLALAGDFVDREAWIEATPLLERALQGFGPDDELELKAKVYRWIGRCASETFNEERAKETFEAALQLGPLNTDDILRLAELYFENEDYNRAQELYQQVLDSGTEEMSAKRLTLAKMNLGECAAKLGQTALAMDYVAEMDESSLEQIEELERMVQVHATSENWAGVISFTEQLLAKRTEDIEKFQDKLVVGDAYRQGLGDRKAAAAAYEKALTYGTFSIAPLLQLVQINLDDQAFDAALGYLQRLADLEEAPEKKSKWLMSMAAVVKDGLKDSKRAAILFEELLDQDSSKLEAFEALVAIRNQEANIQEIEATYLRMIERRRSQNEDVKDKKVLFMLHRNLGEIYHLDMKDTPRAIEQFEMALSYHATDEATRQKVAKLCVRTPECLPRAQIHYRLLISHFPENFTNYHSLSAIWASQGNLDGSWRIAGLLTLFGNAMDAEKRLYQKHLKDHPVRTPFQFAPDIWTNHLRAREQDDELTNVFGVIAPIILGSFFPKKAKALGLGKKQELSKGSHPSIIAMSEKTAALLGCQAPTVYLSGEGEVAVIQADENALTVSSTFAKETNEKVVVYQMARQMTYLRSEHRLARYFDLHALQGLYMAAGCAVNPDFAVRVRHDLPSDQAAQAVHFIQEAALVLKQQLKPKAQNILRNSIEIVEKTFRTHTIEKWQRGVELTSTFAALAAVGDILFVGHTLMDEEPVLSSLTNKEKVQATVGYALSERYTELRQKMNVGVGTG
jgi:tetratricopeptide (TPR) repeat protein